MDLDSLGNLYLEEGVVRMDSVLLALGAEIKVGTLCTFVSDANDGRCLAGVTGDSLMYSLVDRHLLGTSLVLLSMLLRFLERLLYCFERSAMAFSELLEELLDHSLRMGSSDGFSDGVHDVSGTDVLLVVDDVFHFGEKVGEFEVVEDLIVFFLHLFSLGCGFFFYNDGVFLVKFEVDDALL